MKLLKRNQKQEVIGTEIRQVEEEKWYNKKNEPLGAKIHKHFWVVVRLLVCVAIFHVFLGIGKLSSSAYSYSEDAYNLIINQINLSLSDTFIDKDGTPSSGPDMQELHSILDECTSYYNRKDESITLICIIHKGAFGVFDAKVTATLTPDYKLKEKPVRNLNSVEEYSRRYELVRSAVLMAGVGVWIVVELIYYGLKLGIAAIARKLVARKKTSPTIAESLATSTESN